MQTRKFTSTISLLRSRLAHRLNYCIPCTCIEATFQTCSLFFFCMVVYTAFALNFVYLKKLRKSVFYTVLFVCDMTGSKPVYIKKQHILLDIYTLGIFAGGRKQNSVTSSCWSIQRGSKSVQDGANLNAIFCSLLAKTYTGRKTRRQNR